MIEWSETPGGRSARLDQKWVASSRDPSTEGRKWIELNLREKEEVNSIVILGLGVGHHIEPLLNRGDLPRILVVENEVEFSANFAPKMLGRVADVSILTVQDPKDIFASQIMIDIMSEPYAIRSFQPRVQAQSDFFGAIKRLATGRTSESLAFYLKQYGFSSPSNVEDLHEMGALLDVIVEQAAGPHELRSSARILRELLA